MIKLFSDLITIQCSLELLNKYEQFLPSKWIHFNIASTINCRMTIEFYYKIKQSHATSK